MQKGDAAWSHRRASCLRASRASIKAEDAIYMRKAGEQIDPGQFQVSTFDNGQAKEL